jgi:hypothetical protein
VEAVVVAVVAAATRRALSSEQQRQIMSATFNVDRDKPKLAPDKFKENTVFHRAVATKLREQVEELYGRSGAARRRHGESAEDR